MILIFLMKFVFEEAGIGIDIIHGVVTAGFFV